MKNQREKIKEYKKSRNWVNAECMGNKTGITKRSFKYEEAMARIERIIFMMRLAEA
ncbi:MAG: hypothetical protein JXC33_07950 [Deltaproteobacteria bacterium]|nr:hypothetical protein [Deltaproteobacteria bacterium]